MADCGERRRCWALEGLFPLVYDELHRQAVRFFHREREGHTLQPTALVHEVYLRLINQHEVNWQNRAHFFGIAAEMMRRILVSHARAVRRQRGEGRCPTRYAGGDWPRRRSAI